MSMCAPPATTTAPNELSTSGVAFGTSSGCAHARRMTRQFGAHLRGEAPETDPVMSEGMITPVASIMVVLSGADTTAGPIPMCWVPSGNPQLTNYPQPPRVHPNTSTRSAESS